jgi:hypothetical protein
MKVVKWVKLEWQLEKWVPSKVVLMVEQRVGLREMKKEVPTAHFAKMMVPQSDCS